MPAPSLLKGWQRISQRKKRRRDENLTGTSAGEEPEVAREATETETTKRNLVHRGMERIRRSIRESFRRRPKERSLRSGSLVESPSSTQPGGSGINGTSSKAELWLPDEAAVREGNCSFAVKYLGGTEVFESRGMQVCEGALKRLRAQRRRPVKAILYVSGDGLRVVDQENNRGLIVDQTIEKVSFCAPDRNHDKGFAYICRDGSSRRWMCHGFHATKESGERLSHAVGCAFAVCLEKKKKRDEEATLAVQAAADLLPPSSSDKATTSAGFTLKALPVTNTSPSKSSISSNGLGNSSQEARFERSNLAYSSFRRQLSISDRLRDPQTAILQEPPPASQVASTLHITPKPRPAANPQLFERQGSLRAPQSSAEVFRRQFSLRSYSSDFPGQLKNRFGNGTMRSNEPILEGDEDSSWPEKSVNRTSTLLAQTDDFPHINGYRTSNAAQPATTEELRIFPLPTPYSRIPQMCEGLSNSPSRSSNESTPAKQLNASYPARSRADEWLEQTLKTSLSISSSMKSSDALTKTSDSSASCVGPPPDQPPPPLPPKSLLSSHYHPAIQAKFDTDFSKYELPPITETFATTTTTTAIQVTSTKPSSLSANVDLFGQPIFNPLADCSLQAAKETSRSNGSLDNSLGMKTGDFDPFDVKWSEMVMNSANSFQQTPAKSTNPFFNELSAVKTQ